MEPFEEWLFKAERDLLSAQKLFESRLLDTAAYHTQQCAEKALKGFRAFKLQPIEKTHDLDRLVSLCKTLDPDLNN